MDTVPFISITDFRHPREVLMMLTIMDISRSKQGAHQLGIGCMMSYKTLRGLPTKWTDAFPKTSEYSKIFLDRAGLFNVLHYADYNRDSTARDYIDAVLLCGPNLHAIQFDMIWPDPAHLEYLVYRGTHVRKPLKIILQVGAKAMAEVGDDPERVCEKLSWYHHSDCIDYVLLDKSMGGGIGMDATLLLTYIYEIKKRLPNLRIVVAGGLGPTTMQLAEPIIREFPDVSIDAQGQMRTSANALHPIEWTRAGEYIRQANELFGTYNKK